MNILIDKLPTEYEGLKIDTNFRSFILFELLMQDKSISRNDKILMAIRLFFKEGVEDIEKAIECILWFYSMGYQEQEKKEKTKEKGNNRQVYSYEYDADLIYSAFLDQYGVDLNDINYLHWWKFKSMFKGLKSDNRIVEIMGYRAIDVGKIKDKETKKKYRNLQNEYALPDMRSEEEKEKDFAEAFW